MKKLIASHYKERQLDLFNDNDFENPKVSIYEGRNKNEIITLRGDGDFRSQESIEFLKQSDIVITNPPFSLFREYINQLVKYDKKFIILGNLNAITYKNFFPLLKENKVWMGASIHSGDREFRVPNDYPLKASGFRIDEQGKKYIRVKGVRWWTNLDYPQRHEDLILYETYSPEKYPKYDNYDAINVDRVAQIPQDYDGIMGVPITFMDKYNPEQFEIIGQGQGNLYRELTPDGLSQEFVDNYYKSGGKGTIKQNHPVLGYYNNTGKAIIPYMRILIKHKKVKR